MYRSIDTFKCITLSRSQTDCVFPMLCPRVFIEYPVLQPKDPNPPRNTDAYRSYTSGPQSHGRTSYISQHFKCDDRPYCATGSIPLQCLLSPNTGSVARFLQYLHYIHYRRRVCTNTPQAVPQSIIASLLSRPAHTHILVEGIRWKLCYTRVIGGYSRCGSRRYIVALEILRLVRGKVSPVAVRCPVTGYLTAPSLAYQPLQTSCETLTIVKAVRALTRTSRQLP